MGPDLVPYFTRTIDGLQTGRSTSNPEARGVSLRGCEASSKMDVEHCRGLVGGDVGIKYSDNPGTLLALSRNNLHRSILLSLLDKTGREPGRPLVRSEPFDRSEVKGGGEVKFGA